MRVLHTAIRVGLLAACSLAANSHAATVTFTDIVGTWFDADPASSITSTTGSGTGDAEIRWGGASGYNFLAAPGATATLPPPPSASDSFSIGTFQHVNEPVSSSITAVSLAVSANVFVDAVSVGQEKFVFNFSHDETSNSADPCPYGGANFQGVNINGCADKVSVAFSQASDSFLVGTDEYTVNVIGFSNNGTFVTSFLTAEQATNTADLIAQVTLRSLVPEPSTWALFGAGLVALGASRRKKP